MGTRSEEATMRKCSAAFYSTFGFLFLFTSIPKEVTGKCDCKNLGLFKRNCNNTEGIRDFTCFIRYKKNYRKYFCDWKPGRDNLTSYTLYTHQRTCSCVTVNQKLRINNSIVTSDGFSVINGYNMTAHVIATSEDQKSCTYKEFSGTPSQMTRCGPPSPTFKRSSGHLFVEAHWGDESSYVKQFSVRFREFSTTWWNEQISENNRECVVSNLTASRSYEMQIRCARTSECSQCLLELTDAPSIRHEIQDHQQCNFISAGQRRVIVKWEYANSDAVNDYNVTVWKVSGERSNQENYTTKNLSLTLVLSYSAYNISVKALNTAGSSPIASTAIEHMDVWREWFGSFNVSINSNSSFNLSWSSSISSVCYSVEWWAKGQRPAFRSFYVKETHREITKISESVFQPYIRYYFFLHTRPDTDTCNMKNMNNSEKTCSTAQAYLIEGNPIIAPGNVSIFNITQHSSVITWCPVSEEDLRGFLQGYIIYYTENNTETSIIVDPSLNSYELLNLKSNSAYQIQLSAFTAAGEGERSDPKPFVTNPPASTALNSIIAAVIVAIVILLLAVHFSCRLLHRAKKLFWPSIPNPGKSNAVQKIDIGHELDILEPLNRQRLEESEGCDSSTVCVIESKKDVSPLSCPPTSPPGVKPSLLILSEDEAKTPILVETTTPDTPTLAPNKESVSTETFSMDLNEKDSTLRAFTDNDITSPESKDPGDTISNIIGTNSAPAASGKPAVVFMSDYTTMELFQQVAMAGIKGPFAQTRSSGFVSGHPGQDYVRQSCFEGNNNPSGACNGTDILRTNIAVL
ncbi:interleukin-6 receptor subunit beta isoform X2 [Myxocyprinus asiaticus]|uniref:interleukin-6 receptor subunit beta isoform X2 n=1 Tax=Myxocyprinus asiaticus TaxID=70543 RepID=UPI0022213521|nr:interleukin-6 receptor subunit beta isoform X2 [Myxocyprinus asiaticus]